MTAPPSPKQVDEVMNILEKNTGYEWIAGMWEKVPEGENGKGATLRQLLSDLDRRDASYFHLAWHNTRGYHKIEAFKRLKKHLTEKGI